MQAEPPSETCVRPRIHPIYILDAQPQTPDISGPVLRQDPEVKAMDTSPWWYQPCACPLQNARKEQDPQS